MKWSFILYLPAVVAMAWAVIIALTKKRLTHAQILFCLTQIVNAFAITVAGVYLRGRTTSLYIYDYLLEVSTMFSLPMYSSASARLPSRAGPR